LQSVRIYAPRNFSDVDPTRHREAKRLRAPDPAVPSTFVTFVRFCSKIFRTEGNEGNKKRIRQKDLRQKNGVLASDAVTFLP
jgi:hypothetical protein